MVLNYHELTLNEPRDSPARRQQFLVICSIIALWWIYAIYISGILLSIDPVEMNFPGGNFCYKFVARDYVASIGLGRKILRDVYESPVHREIAGVNNDSESGSISEREKKKLIEERIYHVYLDNPELVGGAHTRWMSGVLVPDSEKERYCTPLFDINPEIERQALLHKDEPDTEKTAMDVFGQTIYEYVHLPSINSLAIKFPYTGGFLSALMLSYKIIPQMRALSEKKGEPGNVPVIISQCSEVDGTCTHYVPLTKGKDFLVGKPTTEEYLKLIGDQNELWEAFRNGLCGIFPFAKKYFDKQSELEEGSNNNEEL